MLERVKNFFESIALIILVLIFILFEIRLTIIMPEAYLVALFTTVDAGIMFCVFRNMSKLREMKQ